MLSFHEERSYRDKLDDQMIFVCLLKPIIFCGQKCKAKLNVAEDEFRVRGRCLTRKEGW